MINNSAPSSYTWQDALKAIQSWKWFAYVPAEGQEWLAKRAVLQKFNQGTLVYIDEDQATNIYAVMDGVFRIYLASKKGDEITLEEVVSSGWFPHTIPKVQPHYSGNCVCQQDATVFAFPLSVMAEFSTLWPSYYRGLYSELADRAGVTLGLIELQGLHNVNVRLAVHLLRMAQIRGVMEADGSCWIATDINQTEVGTRVGAARQRVNKALKYFVGKNLIDYQKAGIRILDIVGLTKEAKKSGFNLERYVSSWHGGWQGQK